MDETSEALVSPSAGTATAALEEPAGRVGELALGYGTDPLALGRQVSSTAHSKLTIVAVASRVVSGEMAGCGLRKSWTPSR